MRPSQEHIYDCQILSIIRNQEKSISEKIFDLSRYVDGLIQAGAFKVDKQARQQITDCAGEEKEGTVMQISYNGFTGELVKLENMGHEFARSGTSINFYGLSIFDSGKQVTHSFAGVKLEDIKFLNGEVSFK